jgi:DNA primase
MDEVEEIKQKADVAEVIGTYIQLKQAGRNLKAPCPFHQEKTASFMVSPEKGIWHCFGCHQGGDVIKFVQLIEGLDFRDALEVLAKRVGVELKARRSGDGGSRQREQLQKAIGWAVKYFQASLVHNPKALTYLKDKRHLTRQTVTDFQIGYSPDTWQGLTDILAKKSFSQDEMLKAGLAGQKAGRQNVYDIFRGRIMLTICDGQGQPVGFTGRVLDGGEPKYLNTPQTPLYDKSRVIYGLHLAKDAIRESDEVIIVEGNMDVVASHQAGVKQVVAVSGTALTLDQLKALSRFTKNIKLAFDQDRAGIAATERAIELAGKLGLTLKMIEIEGAKDPDELIQKDPNLWRKAITDAKYVIDYFFDRYEREIDLSSSIGKRQFGDRLAPLLQRLADPAERDRYAQKLAEKIEASVDATQKKIESATSNEPVNARAITVRPQPLEATRSHDNQEELEELVLAMNLAFAEVRISLSDIRDTDFTSLERLAIFQELRGSDKMAEEFAKALPNIGDYVKILTLRGEQEFASVAPADRSFEAFELVRRLQMSANKKHRNNISDQLREAEKNGDVQLARSLREEFQALMLEDI